MTISKLWDPMGSDDERHVASRGGGLKKNWYGNQQNKQYKGSLSRSASYGIMKYVTGVSFNV